MHSLPINFFPHNLGGLCVSLSGLKWKNNSKCVEPLCSFMMPSKQNVEGGGGEGDPCQ